jgi:hypothetical protein
MIVALSHAIFQNIKNRSAFLNQNYFMIYMYVHICLQIGWHKPIKPETINKIQNKGTLSLGQIHN